MNRNSDGIRLASADVIDLTYGTHLRTIDRGSIAKDGCKCGHCDCEKVEECERDGCSCCWMDSN